MKQLTCCGTRANYNGRGKQQLDSLQSHIHVQGHTHSRIWGAKPVGCKAVLSFFLNAPPSSSACRWWNTSRCCCEGSSEHIKKHLFSTDIPREQLAAIWCSLLLQRTPEELVLCTTVLMNIKAVLGSAFSLCRKA